MDKKFSKLLEIEKNDWKEVVPKPVMAAKKKIVKKPAPGGAKKAGASSGLRAMIAAKRKAAMGQEQVPEIKVTEEKKQTPVRKTRRSMASSPAPEIKVTEEKKQTPVRKTRKSMASSPAPENQFDGGFFKITSPARTSPQQSPKTSVSGEKGRRSVGGDHLRRQVLNDSTRRSVSGLILSPFLSQVSRRSLPGPSSPLRSMSPSSPATGT